tara:strand:- start:197 stop:547 length:351 start_codon:yes stop_codon:yes gene_type:complete
MSLVQKIGKTSIVIAPELDKVNRGIGQPKLDWFVKKTIAIKILSYSKTYKISKRKSFLMLCNLSSHTRKEGFKDLMEYHFRNKSNPHFWKDRMINNKDTQINFYKNHVKKWFAGLK